MKLGEELLVAMKAAREAGNLVLRQSGERRIVRFKSKVDFVTNVDKNSEKLITSMIKKRFPDHGIMAEEGTNVENSENLWVIDPLDGTINFMHGYPFFCVSIALVRNGKRALGVVYDPLRKEMFHAVAGGGAYLNGKRIKVSAADELKDSLLVTDFYSGNRNLVTRTLEAAGRFLYEGIQGMRRSGSAAIDMCYVACGRIDGYWEYLLQPWDFAAASLIAKEAGARVTTIQGKGIEIKKEGILVANPLLHEKMLEIVKL
jgi:myo-inositol-1(or 4)-monophosphatase